MSLPSDRIKDIVRQVNAAHRVALTHEDPIFASVTINELVMAALMEAAQDQLTAMLAKLELAQEQLLAAAEKSTSHMLTGAGSYAGDQVRQSVDGAAERFRAVLAADHIRMQAMSSNTNKLLWFTLGACAACLVLIGGLLWYQGRG